MRALVAVREIRGGDLILVEGRDNPCIVASVKRRSDGKSLVTAYDPASVERDWFGNERPTDTVTFVLDDSDLAAVLV